jgi:serine/threonine-protein kinase
VSAESAADFQRDAKRLAKMRHANVALVRDVAVGTNTVLLVTEWIEGETLAGLDAAATTARGASSGRAALSLEVRLRILVDALEGISALHELRDDKREPAPLVHAEVSPSNVVVTTDGRALLTHPLRAPARANRPPSPDALGYLAPEVLLADQTADQRADVYGAGVLLWEALSGRRMHREGEPVGEIVMRLLGGKVEPLTVPSQSPWAAQLVAIAKRATSADPSIRYKDATEMLADVRRAVGTHAASKAAVAAIVEELAGVRIRARRARPSQAEALRAVRSSAPVVVSMPVAPEEARAAAAISTMPPPGAGGDALDPIDVIMDVEVPGAPSIPDVPPPSAVAPPPPSGVTAGPPLRAAPASDVPVPARERDASKTDLGALALASTPPPAMPGKTRWIVGGAAAVAAALVVWLAGRGSEPTATTAHPESSVAAAPANAPPPPTTATAPAEPSPAAAPAPEPEGSKTPASASAEVAPRPALPPVTTAPAAAPPPPPGAPSPPPSSPHPKKRVYDPQGI